MPIDPDNLARWNEVTPHHAASPFYRTDDFRRGEIVLDPIVRDGLARIFGAAMDAGLTIRRFSEGDRVPWKALDEMEKVDPDYWALPPGLPFVPQRFILEAVKEN